MGSRDKLEFLEDAERAGHKIPELEEQPELYEELVWIWNAYGELQNGSGEIAYTDLIAYLNEFEVKGWDERNDFVRLIRALQAEKAAFDKEKLDKRRKAATARRQLKTGKQGK